MQTRSLHLLLHLLREHQSTRAAMWKHLGLDWQVIKYDERSALRKAYLEVIVVMKYLQY